MLILMYKTWTSKYTRFENLWHYQFINASHNKTIFVENEFLPTSFIITKAHKISD